MSEGRRAGAGQEGEVAGGAKGRAESSGGRGVTPLRVVRSAPFPLASLFPPPRKVVQAQERLSPRAALWYRPRNWRPLRRVALVRPRRCAPPT